MSEHLVKNMVGKYRFQRQKLQRVVEQNKTKNTQGEKKEPWPQINIINYTLTNKQKANKFYLTLTHNKRYIDHVQIDF